MNAVPLKRWTREEYDRLVEAGVLSPEERVELLEGDIVLIVEVSDSTLDYDRRRKGAAYARAEVPEYWIVNLVDRLVEVYRDPTANRGYQTALSSGRRHRPARRASDEHLRRRFAPVGALGETMTLWTPS